MSIRREVPLSQAQYKFSPPSDWVIPQEIDWALEAPEEDGLAYLLRDFQYNIDTHAHYIRIIKKLSSGNAVQSLSQIPINFDHASERLIIHEIAVWKFTGDEEETGNEELWQKRSFAREEDIKLRQREQNLESNIIDGQATILCLLENVRVGDAIEVNYTIEQLERIPLFKFSRHLMLADSNRIGWLHIAIHSKKQITSQWKIHNLQEEIDREERHHKQYHTLRWQRWHPKLIKYESNVPFGYFFTPLLEISEWESWNSVAQFTCETWKEASDTDAELLTERLEQIITHAEATSPLEKAEACIRYVQDEIRYLAVDIGYCGGLIPKKISDTLMSMYGDCKDKSILLTVLLRKLEIEAYPVLVGTGWRETLEVFYPSSQLFNHAIVLLKHAGNDYYIDPTLSYQGGGVLKRINLPYKRGLVIKEDSKDLVEIPSENEGDYYAEVLETFNLSPTNPYIEYDLLVEGGFADGVRAIVAKRGLKSYLKQEAKDYCRFFPNTTLATEPDYKMEDNREKNTLSIKAYFSLGEWQKNHNGVLVFEYGARFMFNHLERVDDNGDRRHPWALYYPQRIKQSVCITESPFNKIVDKTDVFTGPGFKYKIRLFNTKGSPTLVYEWLSTASSISAGEWPSYLKKRKEAIDEAGCYLHTNNETKTIRRLSEQNNTNIQHTLEIISILLIGYGLIKLLIYTLTRL